MKNLPKTIKYFLVLGIIFQSVFGFFWQGDPSTGSGNRTKVAYAATGLSVTSSAVSAVYATLVLLPESVLFPEPVEGSPCQKNPKTLWKIIPKTKKYFIVFGRFFIY